LLLAGYTGLYNNLLSKKTNGYSPQEFHSTRKRVCRVADSHEGHVSAMKVATYRTKVIDKELLKKKLHSLPLPEEYLDEDKL